RSRSAGIVTETVFERVAPQGSFRHGSAFLSPTSLPAANHPARDLALSAVHPELPRRGGATGGARLGGFLCNGAAVGFEVRARVRSPASTMPPTAERPV